MDAKARTNSGCWTCRIRHKKCDEHPKTCDNCTSLGIECDGYGRKPDWMDGSIRESEYLNSIKAVVRKTNSRRKRARYSRHQSISTTIDSLPTPPESAVLSSSHSIQSESRGISPTNSSTSPLHTELLDYDPSNCGPVTTFIQKQDFEALGSSQAYALPSALNLSPQALESSLCNPNRTIDWDCCNGLEPAYPCNSESCATCFEEANMILGYLSHTLKSQFPFLATSARPKGGWIYLLLKRSTMFHFATVSLSAYDAAQNSPTSLDSPVSEQCMTTEAAAHYNMLALQRLQDCLRNLNPSQSDVSPQNLEILASIMQLLFCDVLEGSNNQLQMHMKAISTLLPILLNVVGLLRPRNLQRPTYPFLSIPSSTHIPSPSASDFIAQSAVPFLTGAFVWFDILSSASSRTKHHHLSDHGLLLSKSGASIEESFGCQTWVLLAIAKITDLDGWKEGCKQGSILSLTELVTKALDLRALLTSGLLDPKEAAENGSYVLTTLSPELVTATFATAALIYLDVVVSGPFTNLPEIRQSVSRAIAYFRNISLPDLSPRLAWPLCVTGCLASGDEREFFIRLIGNDVNHGLRKALEVVRQCWIMRDTQGMADAEWTSAIQVLGGTTLLI